MSDAHSLRLLDAGSIPMRDRRDYTWASLWVVRRFHPARQGARPQRPSIIPFEDNDIPCSCQNRARLIDALVGNAGLRGNGGDAAGEHQVATDDDDLQRPGRPSSRIAVWCWAAAPASGGGGVSDGSMTCGGTAPLWLPAWSVRSPSVTYRAIRIG